MAEEEELAVALGKLGQSRAHAGDSLLAKHPLLRTWVRGSLPRDLYESEMARPAVGDALLIDRKVRRHGEEPAHRIVRCVVEESHECLLRDVLRMILVAEPRAEVQYQARVPLVEE